MAESRNLVAGVRNTLTPQMRGASPGVCRPSCCKSPFGHSTVRDAFPRWHKDACRCHPNNEIGANDE
jgi:hypothetical protein